VALGDEEKSTSWKPTEKEGRGSKLMGGKDIVLALVFGAVGSLAVTYALNQWNYRQRNQFNFF